VSVSMPFARMSRFTCDMSYRVVGQMSGQYMKPKNKKDQRASSDLRSKTPFASSTSANSAKGLRSGKAISAGGRSDADGGFRVCQSVQYPPMTRATPTRAAAASNTREMRCRVAECGKVLAPVRFRWQSDNRGRPASIMPYTIGSNTGRMQSACITLGPLVSPAHYGASFFQ
jgi:hypothetical protein